MHSLHFDKLIIVNFKAMISPQTLDFGAMDCGLHYLRGQNEAEPRLGPNGAGKTSIWDALCWCLYGKTARGLRGTDVVPWFGRDKKVSVQVELLIDGKRHVVKRSQHPNSFLIDGEEASGDVAELLGLPYSVFTSTVILGQGEPLFFDLQPAAKMALFVDALQLERWDKRAARASDESGKLSDELTGVNAAVKVLQSKLQVTEGDLARLRKLDGEWESDRQAKLEGAIAELKPLRKRLELAVKRLSEADLAYDGAKAESKALTIQLEKDNKLVRKAQLDTTQAAMELLRGKDRVKELKEAKAQIGRSANCPTCGQPLKKSGASLARHNQELQQSIVEAEARVKKLTTALEAKEGVLIRDQQFMGRTQADLKAMGVKAEKAEAEIALHGRTKQDLDIRIKVLEKQIAEWEAGTSPYSDEISRLRKRLTSDKAELKEAEGDSEKIERQLERTQYWVKGFRNIRLSIIEEVLHELELTTNSMLEEVGLVGWSVLYSSERETKAGTSKPGLHVVINSPHSKDAVRWESWSGGEGQRLRVVSALALSEVLLNYAGVMPDLEVLDEPTQHMSAEGIRDLCEFLADRAHSLDRKIWYVDHNVVESSRFASITTVRRQKGDAGSIILQE